MRVAVPVASASLVLSVVLLLMLLPAEARADEFEPGIHELSAVYQLGAARDAITQLATAENPETRRALISTALASLTVLYQLHGCEWAQEPITELLGLPDCPPLLMGYSADGRLLVRAEPLELRNPVFVDHTVLLFTLLSNTAQKLTAEDFQEVTLVLVTGEEITADHLSPEHPLWSQLEKLIHTFSAPAVLDAGGGQVFKSVIAWDNYQLSEVVGIELKWAGYTVYVPNYAVSEGKDE